jgi:hypothetical protein
MGGRGYPRTKINGGILIGRVYGHLNDEHKVATAKHLTFFDRPANITDIPQQSAG